MRAALDDAPVSRVHFETEPFPGRSAIVERRVNKGAVMKTITALDSPPTSSTATGRMKALVYPGPGRRAWEERPRPVIQAPTDAIVRITTSTICGTDLHSAGSWIRSRRAAAIAGVQQ